MTRNEYMEQLKKYLKRLPKEDYDNAIEYFSEYFDEAGSENEQQVMEELGEPREAARELLLNLLQESVGGGKDSTGEKTAALPEAEAEADAAVEVEAAPPQAARLSAMAPARNADTRRFIYGSSLSGKQLRFIALPC